MLLFFQSCYVGNQLKNVNKQDFSNFDKPVALTKIDCGLYDNQVVFVVGIYEEFDTRMMQRNPKVLYKGNAVIRLKDGHQVVLLPPDVKASIRPKSEIKKHRGKLVLVKGIIHPYIPREYNRTNIACFSSIDTIQSFK